jgi:alkylation response protein AidB-like acyl-CoA dehydrogenase
MSRTLHDLIRYCRSTADVSGRPLIENARIRDRLRELAVIAETQRLMAYDSVHRQDAGLDPALPGLTAVSFREAMPRFADLCTQVIGPAAQLRASSAEQTLANRIEFEYRRSFANHAGGTSQVKRMVLATRGLRLPRR